MSRRSLRVPARLPVLIFVTGCTTLQIGQDVQLGRNALRARQPAIAVSYLRQAADLDPNYRAPDPLRESVLTYLGRAYYEQGNFSEARNVLEKALANNPDAHSARLYLGLALLRSGDQERGRREVESGLKGIYAALQGLATSPYRGIFWDPQKKIRSEIQRALNEKLDQTELITIGEWIGSKLDEEVEVARRDELRERFFRGGDN
jgi:tetratricopeptide (TPR) repeat protein